MFMGFCNKCKLFSSQSRTMICCFLLPVRGNWYSFSQKRKTAYFKLKDHFVNFYIDNNNYNMNNNNNNCLLNACVAPGIFMVP